MLLIRIKQYFIWFLANFVFCLLPLLVTYIIDKSGGSVFQGFISFTVTILVTSLYVSDAKSCEKGLLESPNLLKWTTILMTFILWILYILYQIFSIYPSIISTSTKCIVENNFNIIFITILAITSLLSVLLHKDSIDDVAIRAHGNKLKQPTQKFKSRIESMKEELLKENLG